MINELKVILYKFDKKYLSLIYQIELKYLGDIKF